MCKIVLSETRRTESRENREQGESSCGEGRKEKRGRLCFQGMRVWHGCTCLRKTAWYRKERGTASDFKIERAARCNMYSVHRLSMIMEGLPRLHVPTTDLASDIINVLCFPCMAVLFCIYLMPNICLYRFDISFSSSIFSFLPHLFFFACSPVLFPFSKSYM